MTRATLAHVALSDARPTHEAVYKTVSSTHPREARSVRNNYVLFVDFFIAPTHCCCVDAKIDNLQTFAEDIYVRRASYIDHLRMHRVVFIMHHTRPMFSAVKIPRVRILEGRFRRGTWNEPSELPDEK